MSAECRHVCAISLQLWSSVQLIDYIHVLIWQINQMLLNHTHSTQHNHSKIKHKAHFPCQSNILYFGTDILMSQMPVEACNNKILYFIRWGRKKWYRPLISAIGRPALSQYRHRHNRPRGHIGRPLLKTLPPPCATRLGGGNDENDDAMMWNEQ